MLIMLIPYIINLIKISIGKISRHKNLKLSKTPKMGRKSKKEQTVEK